MAGSRNNWGLGCRARRRAAVWLGLDGPGWSRSRTPVVLGVDRCRATDTSQGSWPGLVVEVFWCEAGRFASSSDKAINWAWCNGTGVSARSQGRLIRAITTRGRATVLTIAIRFKSAHQHGQRAPEQCPVRLMMQQPQRESCERECIVTCGVAAPWAPPCEMAGRWTLDAGQTAA